MPDRLDELAERIMLAEINRRGPWSKKWVNHFIDMPGEDALVEWSYRQARAFIVAENKRQNEREQS